MCRLVDGSARPALPDAVHYAPLCRLEAPCAARNVTRFRFMSRVSCKWAAPLGPREGIMAIELSRAVRDIQPERCVLFFGSGAALTSGAPSVDKLIRMIGQRFNIDPDGLSLREISQLAEGAHANRRELIAAIRPLFRDLKPAGGLLNLPLFQWKGLYTTNYDNLIEQTYAMRSSPLNVYSSNFDFSQPELPGGQKLFKLHGTIDKDVVDGSQSRIILTDDDYDLTAQYREALFARLQNDLVSAQLVIIGHSLADAHIKEIVERAVKLNAETHNHRQITLLVYTKDDRRATLLEARGIQVVFAGVDDFFAELARQAPSTTAVRTFTGDPLDAAPLLNGMVRSVVHASSQGSNVSSMFNGWPGTYGDIRAGMTFERSVSRQIISDLVSGEVRYATIVGASGVGKTTAARQVMAQLSANQFHAWEHDNAQSLIPDAWRAVAARLAAEDQSGVLFVDEASSHLVEINRLIDNLASDGNSSLCVVLASAKASWTPRIKSIYLNRFGREYVLRRVDSGEVDRLLNLVDQNSSIKALVEASFKGFSRYERRRRLVERCESDFFVCMRNIFASEKFDDIVLREYAALGEDAQAVYKTVAALESAGVQVHRQLILRLLGVRADGVGALLDSLSEIVIERTVNEREGIYGWMGRHQVISHIIARYKFADQEAIYDLLRRVIEESSPTYQIEVRSLRELCSQDFGIPRISSKSTQNVLYRMVMSVVPGERVPRHKLIRNLIKMGDFEGAATEIRIFDADFREDGPVTRYKIDLMVARAESSPGLMREDRVAILQDATEFAEQALNKFGDNKYVLNAYANSGIVWYRFTADTSVFDAAIESLRAAEERTSDPEISSMIARLSRTFSSAPAQETAEASVDINGEGDD